MSTVYIFHQSLGAGKRWQSTSEVSLDQILARSPLNAEARQILKRSTVLLFGAGSGGSKLAQHLAQAGLGRLVLCDPGLLALHNLSRHIGFLEEVGQPKVEVTARHILQRVPGAVVDTYPLDVFSTNSLVSAGALAAEADLIIAATDRLAIQLRINQLSWAAGKPAVFGGCYESARGGEVFFHLPGQGTPCLACLRGGFTQPEPQGPFDYSQARSLEDYEGQPGLAAAVDLITDIEAQIALAVLLRNTQLPLASLADPRLCFLLIGGAQADGFYRFQRPFDIHYQALAGPRPDCPVCQAGLENNTDVPDLPAEIPSEYADDWHQWTSQAPLDPPTLGRQP